MAVRYISDKTAALYRRTSGRSHHMVLIFGDEIDARVSATPVNGRIPATFRGRRGFVNVSEIGSEAPLEIYFIDVGQGDSTFIVTPGRRKILIDGGKRLRALGFVSRVPLSEGLARTVAWYREDVASA